MSKERVIDNSLVVVKELGKETRAKIRLDKDIEPEYDTFERIYSNFGLEIVFIEKSNELVAIWFDGDLVFSTVTSYNPDRYGANSKYFTRLDITNLSEVYEEGDWEEILEILAENHEEVKAKLDEMSRAAEKMNEKIDELNEDMLRYLKFKYVGGDEATFPDREFRSGDIFVVGRGYERDHLQVYVKKVKVFDHNTMTIDEGEWEQTLKRIMAPEKAKKRIPEAISDNWVDELFAELNRGKKQPKKKKEAQEMVEKLKKLLD